MARLDVRFLLACLVAALGCDDSGSDGSAPSDILGTGPAYGAPPLLDEAHPGWVNPECDLCHNLPESGHTVTARWVCSQCHGANGACHPNGFNDTYNEHAPSDDCVACHGENHRFTEARQCSTCHFRELGQRACEDAVAPPPVVVDDPPPPLGTPPELSNDSISGCYEWPEQPFSAGNVAVWETRLAPGELAVDFTLRDTAGNVHTLSQLLSEKPVWLQLGNYTCPVYQNAVTALNTLVTPGAGYADQVHFVHVYSVEAHPQSPDVSPYRGRVWELRYSTLPNPIAYDGRLENALVMEPLIAGSDTLLLVDDLTPGGMNNPVWCTYGTCPACSYLIGRDGIIREVITRTPNDAAELEASLLRLLAP